MHLYGFWILTQVLCLLTGKTNKDHLMLTSSAKCLKAGTSMKVRAQWLRFLQIKSKTEVNTWELFPLPCQIARIDAPEGQIHRYMTGYVPSWPYFCTAPREKCLAVKWVTKQNKTKQRKKNTKTKTQISVPKRVAQKLSVSLCSA